GWILAYFPWYCVFLIPSGVVLVMLGVDYALVRESPKAAGFPEIDTGDASSGKADKDAPVDFAYLVANVFTNPVILTLVAAEFCTGFARQGLLLWFVPFLKEVHHIGHGDRLFSIATLGITLGGIAGGILCG